MLNYLSILNSWKFCYNIYVNVYIYICAFMFICISTQNLKKNKSKFNTNYIIVYYIN